MTFQLKIQIEGITKPPVWRRVIVPDMLTFEQFHFVIQHVFGWTNAHLFEFCPQSYGSYPTIAYPHENDKHPVEDVRTFMLKDFFHTEQQQITYIYDFGDNWRHKITLEVITPDSLKDVKCIEGIGKCPPEDCGGVWGYEHLKKVISDPHDPEHEEKREWLGLEPKQPWSAELLGTYKPRNLSEEYPFLSFWMPEFNHPEVKIFYYNSYDIDRDTLHAIMSLPRQTLIEDMQKLLIDCIERYKYFMSSISDAFFPIHAMYVLSSLRAEEALDTVLFIMNQNKEIKDFWFGERVIIEFWQYLYLTGQNQTDKLKDFFYSPDCNTAVHLLINTTTTQIAIHQPERKQAMIQLKTEAIEYLLDNIDNTAIYNSYVLECIVCDLAEIGDISVLPLIKRCFDEGQLSEKEVITLSDTEERVKSDTIESYYYSFKLFEDIDQFYDEWKTTDIELYGEKKLSPSFLDFNKPITPFIATPKTGRNDPCPCGSGKKYKKCCGK